MILCLQHYVPNLALEILHHNKESNDSSKINLQGFLVGEDPSALLFEIEKCLIEGQCHAIATHMTDRDADTMWLVLEPITRFYIVSAFPQQVLLLMCGKCWLKVPFAWWT